MSEQNTSGPVTFVVACKSFFGLLPGETLQQFVAELRALTPGDKQELISMFKEIGIDASKAS